MMRILLPVFVAACSSAPVTGTVVNGLTGEPIAGESLVLQATGEASLSCQRFETTTGEDGSFEVKGPCVPDNTYGLKLPGAQLIFFDDARISAAAAGRVEAFPAFDGTGVYELDATGALQHLPTHADVRSENLWESEEVVEFPSVMPVDTDTPQIGAGEYLVFLGQALVEGATLQPLVPSEGRKFGNPEQITEMADPWWYVGLEFTTDTEFRRRHVLPESSKVVNQSRGDIVVRYLAADSVPAGRYAIREPGSRRMTIVAFGG